MTIEFFSNAFSCAHRIIPGEIEKEHFLLLIDISTIRSDKIINALNDYFVLGETRAAVCQKYNVNQGYLSLKIRELQALSAKIYNLFPFYA
ncbi:hypothetical protein G3151_005315 [Salmonella enterica subsp. enterica serovar Montevideo]|nr:hypothetical protein [Salmonella enterica subsp. enterica serovar Montevideo]